MDGHNNYIIIGIKLLYTYDVGVSRSLHSKTHPLFSTVMAKAQSVMHTSIQACFLCFFLQFSFCSDCDTLQTI